MDNLREGDVYRNSGTGMWVRITREPVDGVVFYEPYRRPDNDGPEMSLDEKTFLEEHTRLGRRVR